MRVVNEYNTAITSQAFNDPRTYTYFEKDVNEDDPSVRIANQISRQNGALKTYR